MSIRKRESKKIGYVYEIYFNYKETGITRRYSKSSFLTKKGVQEIMRNTNINTIISVYTHINDEHKLNVVNDIFKTKSVEN